MSDPPALNKAALTNLEMALRTSERSPALSILVCFALGILIDSCFHLELIHWLRMGILLTATWFVSFRFRWNSIATIILLLVIMCLGGMHHHRFWFCHTPDHITRLLIDDDKRDQPARLIRVTGVISSKPLIKISAAHEQFNPDQPTQRTSFTLDCKEVIQDKIKIPVSGKIRVTVYDPGLEEIYPQNSSYSIGDTLDLSGELKAISRPDNPADFDFQTHFRKQQIDAFLTVKSSHAIKIVYRSYLFGLVVMRQEAHDFMAQLIINNTSKKTQSLGLALLLGDRSELKPEIRKQFSQSGLIHFLAISGLHIGFFTIFVWSVCHVLNTPRIVAVIILILAIVFYLAIIEIRPPILRAASFCILVTLGLINWRTITTLNLVCITALVILIINPTDLFDVGTQLSFLAVSSILWTVQQGFYQNPFQQSWVPLRWRILASDPVLQSPLQWLIIRYCRLVYSIALVTFFIWITTAPLVLYHFKLLAPVGLIINTLIFPFLFLILFLGYLLIFIGPLLPFLAPLFGFCFDSSLRFLLWVVETGSSIPFAHFTLAGPPAWWLIIYYTFILIAIIPIHIQLSTRTRWILDKLRLTIVPVWIIAGILIQQFPAHTSSLKCTFIAVNHGVSILIQTPNGQSILYDAGSMSPVDYTYSKITNTLLEQGVRRIDLLLISHADRDHYNSAAQLITNQFVRELAFPQSFLDQRQHGTIHLCDTADQRQVPIKIIGKGDRFQLGPELSIEVLHPGFAEKYQSDNAASLTILLSFQRRRILLTGDIEGEGLEKLLAENLPEPVDVLLAPHHGSLSANTTDLEYWAQPDYVIVSGGKKDTIPKLQNIFSKDTQIYSTYMHGAITCLIDSNGALKVTPFRKQE